MGVIQESERMRHSPYRFDELVPKLLHAGIDELTIARLYADGTFTTGVKDRRLIESPKLKETIDRLLAA